MSSNVYVTTTGTMYTATTITALTDQQLINPDPVLVSLLTATAISALSAHTTYVTNKDILDATTLTQLQQGQVGWHN